ncbi:RNA repair transcriptional activator RtcR [Actibacterium sp. 188UL27-1]|uniref:RNA repair transcriptional activator RtcR n=1 Tax=Actibacterium sp. 188UL27-1 TaxID=2786961 RepID=UPI00195C617D|nr:RNA repair transcriptional activator RtcR [Actibacterium sp. 188UL27-1]MBM7066621.1 RNA repair transcriptional activator RtcR [Actibacterium sp. 188UL27-1]
MQNVVISFLGTQLDRGRKRKWRPSIQMCAHADFPIARLELLYDDQWLGLAQTVQEEIARISPDTEVLLNRLDLTNPWDFEEVYGKLFDFARAYGFDEDREHYHVHLTTGTHVAQICWFLLTESRHIPARLLQTGPPRNESQPSGTLDVIDLDLSRYDALQQRFDLVSRDYNTLLKAGIETRNPAFNALIDRIEQVASASDAPLLLQGETGTGKTQLAERIYELKRRRRRVKGRFVQINCATLRGPMAAATLFGQRRSVTGVAGSERAGLLREADGGVLFLDEVDDLGPDEQGLLLDAIERGRFYPLGSDQPVKSQFHVIAGVNQDLADLVGQGRFRADLYARLNMWTFRLPALRDRREDIPPNLEYELEQAEKTLGTRVGFNADAAQTYTRFAQDPASPWPGNFRDLSASIQRLCVLSPRGRITHAAVEHEMETLRTQWSQTNANPDAQLVQTTLGPDAAALDPFDIPQLAHVIRICRTSPSLSAAGRTLFAASRAQKSSRNDADRLRKYLARFDLTWDRLT